MADTHEHPPAFAGHIGQRIRYYRRLREMKQIDLARKAEINQGFLSEIERGKRKPSPASIGSIAKALQVATAVLIGEGPDHDSPQPLETMDLPMFAEMPTGLPTKGHNSSEAFPVLRHLWAPDRYVLRLSFDSMEPTLKPGDLVLVQYRPGVNPEHVQGRVCACLIDGVPNLKRVSVEQQQDKCIIILRGDNPAVQPTIVDDHSDFTIQGIVTHLVSRDL